MSRLRKPAWPRGNHQATAVRWCSGVLKRRVPTDDTALCRQHRLARYRSGATAEGFRTVWRRRGCAPSASFGHGQDDRNKHGQRRRCGEKEPSVADETEFLWPTGGLRADDGNKKGNAQYRPHLAGGSDQR